MLLHFFELTDFQPVFFVSNYLELLQELGNLEVMAVETLQAQKVVILKLAFIDLVSCELLVLQ